jgi:hypothetical protein
MVTAEKNATYLTEAQVRFLRQQVERFVAEPEWPLEIDSRRRVAAKYRMLVEATGIRGGGELSRDQLAEMVLCVREIQKLNRIVLPQILGTFTYYRYFKGFDGSREDFSAHMAQKRSDWPEGSLGYDGLDTAALSRDLSVAFAAPKAKLGPAYARLLEYPGVGRGLATAFLLLWDPRRHAVINALPPGLFRAKRGPLTIGKGMRDRVRAQARREYGLEGPSYKTSVANTFAWTILLGEIREVCGFEDFLEVDLLLRRITNEAGDRSARGAPKAAPEAYDIERVIEAGLAKLTPERLATRQQAIADAHALITRHVGQFGEAELRELIKFFNTDFPSRRTTGNRFSLAFAGRFLHELVARADEANVWIQRLWEADEPADLEHVLDEFWDESPLPGAGSSFPSLVLHAKDPARFPPLMSGLAQGYERLTSKPVHKRKGSVYLQYAQGVRALCEAHNISPHAVDLVLLAALRAPSVAEDEGVDEAPGSRSYDQDAFLEETLLESGWLEEVEALLSDKPQLVLYGPPGTGKTWVAERLARYFTADRGEVRLVQFHPSYSYEDFIEGIRPALDGQTGQLTYKVEKGLFRDFCEQAAGRPDETFVLIIDEINRGNMSKILGELITLLESDKRLAQKSELKLPLSYTPQHRFAVPPNLHVLGTMNTADRSIALMDVALRRRFTFEELMPDTGVIRSVLRERVPDKAFIDLVADVFDALNDRIRFLYDRDHQLGHSYFLDVTDVGSLRQVFVVRVVPMLQEYFYGAWDKICIVLGCPYNEAGEPKRNNRQRDSHLLAEDGKTYVHPIVTARAFPEVRTLGFHHDDYEDRVDYQLRGAFQQGSLSAEDLYRTFLGALSIDGADFNQRLAVLRSMEQVSPEPVEPVG